MSEKAWPARVHVGKAAYRPNDKQWSRLQEHHQLLLLHSGSLKLTVNDEPAYSYADGTAIWLAQGTHTTLEFSATVTSCHTWIYYIGQVDDQSQHLLGTLLQSMPVSDQLERAVEDALYWQTIGSVITAQLVWSLAYQAFWLYVYAAEAFGGQQPHKDNIVNHRAWERFMAKLIRCNALLPRMA